MPIHERDRIRFHGWLVDHDLDREVADAILATMPPYDWHELATKTDLAVLEQRMDAQFTLVYERMDMRFALVDGRFDSMDTRFDGMDRRLDGMDRRLDNMDSRLGGIAQEMRTILFTMIGLIVSILLAGGAVLVA